MTMLTVALLQMTSHGPDQAANLEKGDAFCRRAQAMGADIALFPEMWNIGYTFFDDSPGSRSAWTDRAVGPDGPFVTHFKELARELNMAIAITYLERWAGGPRDTLTLIDRFGAHALTYAKVHTCDFDREAELARGDDFYVAALDTAQGPVQVGAMICVDREFPESARLLMLKGAEIILTPNACEMEENRTGQFAARAFENMLGVALTNYAAPQYNGHSVAFNGVAFNRDESSRNHKVVEAGEAEGIYLAHFDLEQMRRYRSREAWGNAFRRPDRYHLLTAPEVDEPFFREDARR